MPAATAVSKAKALAALESETNRCSGASAAPGHSRYVFGKGNPDGTLILIGEAPGFQEAAQGIPFVGSAGKLLDRLISQAGINPASIYFTNVVKFRPLRDALHPEKPRNNRPPTGTEIAACLPILEQQIAIIQPDALCALGNTALRALLQTKANVSVLHGTLYHYNGIPLLPTFHPAAVFHNPRLMQFLLDDLRKLCAVAG